MPNEIINWRKSLHSANDGACVDVASHVDIPTDIDLRATIYVRHSKRPEGVMLKFRANEWEAFLARIIRGDTPIDGS